MLKQFFSSGNKIEDQKIGANSHIISQINSLEVFFSDLRIQIVIFTHLKRLLNTLFKRKGCTGSAVLQKEEPTSEPEPETDYKNIVILFLLFLVLLLSPKNERRKKIFR